MAYQLILKNKDFEIEKLISILEKDNFSFKKFKENFGTIIISENLKYLSELKEKFKANGIETLIIKSQKLALPVAEKPKTVKIKGEKFFFSSKTEFCINLKEIKILALGIIYKEYFHHNPFFMSEKKYIWNIYGMNQMSKDIEIFLEIFCDTKPYRIKLNSNNLEYSSFHKKDYSSLINFKNFIAELREFSKNAITNKTFDLFLENKNIKYFIYEDYLHFEKELKWLIFVNNFDL